MAHPALHRFARDELGAATFDWKVLGALTCALGIAAGTYAYDGTEAPAANIEAKLSDGSLPDQIFPGRAID